MKIFQTPSYDRFCLFEMERKSKDFRGMDDNVAYKNKQIDNVEISNEGRRALREKLREVIKAGALDDVTRETAETGKSPAQATLDTKI